MKKFIILIAILFAGMAVSAQVQLKSFDNDTIKATTANYVSNQKVKKYSTTTVAFVFTHTDVADSLSVAKIQGSLDNTNFYDLADASANLLITSTDGTSRLYVENPIDLYFKGVLTAATGDTVAITNAKFVIKED